MDAVTALLEQNRANALNVLSSADAHQFVDAGYASFDALWELPQNFVEPANLRRNGWSGVSLLRVPNAAGGQDTFYLKRQENQSRYSLTYPTGALTFRYEVDALRHALQQGWPSVELVAYGFRMNPDNGMPQGLLVTRALSLPSLASCADTVADWVEYLPQLTKIGSQLLGIHRSGWQHGALFPGHIFVDLATGGIRLIDFERARKRLRGQWAAYADFTQFMRRCDWLPDEALSAMLAPYQDAMPPLIKRLRKRFPHRFQ